MFLHDKSKSIVLLTYLDGQGEEQVEEISAYSLEQARYLASDFIPTDGKLLSLEQTVRHTAG